MSKTISVPRDFLEKLNEASLLAPPPFRGGVIPSPEMEVVRLEKRIRELEERIRELERKS